MVLMNYRELAQMYRGMGATQACEHLSECLELGRAGKPGGIKPSDFSLRDLAEAVVPDGREWVRGLDPRDGGRRQVMEAGEAVDTTAFSNITGQLLINELMAGYEAVENTISRLFKTIPTRLDGEKIIGLAKPEDDTEEVHPGMPFPSSGFGEDYIETPSTTKRGKIIPVTKEAVFFDLTGQMLENANSVGENLGTNKEKRCVDVLIGAVNNHSWKGTAYNTYQAATPWINLLSGSTYDLVDWTDVDAAEELFINITDPNTGEPININATTIIAAPARRHALNRILNATEIRYTASGAPTETLAPNPLAAMNYTGITNKYVYSRLQSELSISATNAKATWFLGDFMKAFAYMENWPITVVQAPQNSEAEFTQDIVARFKASERGVAFAKNPRYVVKVTGY